MPRVLWMGPDQRRAQQTARAFAGFGFDPVYGMGEWPERFVVERIAEDDPDFPEFKWRVVAYTDGELARG